MITRYLKIYPDAANRLRALSSITRQGTLRSVGIGAGFRPSGDTGTRLPAEDLPNRLLEDTFVWSYEI